MFGRVVKGTSLFSDVSLMDFWFMNGPHEFWVLTVRKGLQIGGV